MTNIFLIVRANYERGVPVDKSFLRKTARLVQEKTSSGDILKPTEVYSLDEATLEKIAASNQPETVRVFNLLKALHDHIKQMAQQQPWLISIGDRAEAVAQAFEERQKTTHEALEQLQALITEVRDAERARTESELSPEAFAVLWYLKNLGGHPKPASRRHLKTGQ